jgi:hypothetical protein
MEWMNEIKEGTPRVRKRLSKIGKNGERRIDVR